METARYLGQSHRPTTDLVTAKIIFFSLEKSIPGDSTDHIWTLLETALTLDRHVIHFLFVRFTSSYGEELLFELSPSRIGEVVQKVRFRASFLRL